MSIKTKIIKARIKNFLTRERFIESYKKKKAILVVVLTIINMYILNDVINLASGYEIQIKQRTITNIVSAKSITKEIVVKEEKPKYDLEEIADKIRRLESSGGKNDSCLKIGKINGYGYMQSKQYWECFDTHEEVRGKVLSWLEKHLIDENMSLQEALCHYNQGNTANGECSYVYKYNML